MTNAEVYRKISKEQWYLRIDIALLMEDLEDLGKRMKTIADRLEQDANDLARISAEIEEANHAE